MALYTIADLHLPLGIDKPMDIFGKAWENYVERLADNWQSVVKENDVIVLPGDFSWATYLEQSVKDFEYLHKLNGKKILLKGNHDYWWESITKLTGYVEKNGFNSISFLHNSAVMVENKAICGTRGWIDKSNDNFKEDDLKIYNREIMRLDMSLCEAEKFSPEEKIAFLHYPPVTKDLEINEDYLAVLKKHGVKRCFYGHIHSKASKKAAEGTFDGIDFKLVSADYMGFMPYKLS